MPPAHTVESATAVLRSKGLSFLSVGSISPSLGLLRVIDEKYGEYQIEIKYLSPSMKVPLHRLRKHQNKVDNIRSKYVGRTIKGLDIIDVFYGPDRGYKNRSFYIVYRGVCGHEGINTYAALTRHVKSFSCRSCAAIDHGERGKIEGKLKKRTSTYIYWQRVRKTLPLEYQEFSEFKAAFGDKPPGRAEAKIIDSRPIWVSLTLDEDKEINLIATAVRQAFRHSAIYKNAIEAARVETDQGPRYICAACGKLFKRTDIEVDHMVPISPLSGLSLQKGEIIDTVWTDKIQILHKGCHTKKSTAENAQRRKNKKERNK